MDPEATPRNIPNLSDHENGEKFENGQLVYYLHKLYRLEVLNIVEGRKTKIKLHPIGHKSPVVQTQIPTHSLEE